MMTLSRRIILQGLLAGVATGALAQQPPNGVPAPTPVPVRGRGAPGAGTGRRPLRGDAVPTCPSPSTPSASTITGISASGPSGRCSGSGGSQYRMQLFHLGFLYQRPVTVNVLRDGVPTPVPYQRELFNYGRNKIERPLPVNLGFAGFRLHYPINTPKVFDEVIAFLGRKLFPLPRLGPEIRPLGARSRHQRRRWRGGGISLFPGILDPDADRGHRPRHHLCPAGQPVGRGRLSLRSLSFAGNHSRGHRHAVPPPDHRQSRPRTPDLHVFTRARTTGRRTDDFRPELHDFGRPADAIRAPASGSGGLCAIRPRRRSRRSATTIPAASD